MTASYPSDSVIALVREGFGSLLEHCTARYLGLKSRETTIFGANDDPGSDLPAALLSPTPGTARMG